MLKDNVFQFVATTWQDRASSPGFVERLCSGLARRASRLLCGMQGHFMLLHLEPHRISIRCGLCGYGSEGWEVGHRRPTPRAVVRKERRQVPRPLKAGVRLAS